MNHLNVRRNGDAVPERRMMPDEIATKLSAMFAPYSELCSLVLYIYEQSKLSSSRQLAFESGVKIAKARATDRDTCGIGISIDDVVFSQLFTGFGGAGRLDVLINNCKAKLERLTHGGWSPNMTQAHISEAFRNAEASEGKGGVPNWDYALSGILQFMRTAYTVRSIQETAERMYAAKQSKACVALGLPVGTRLPSNVFMKFPEVDSYTQAEVKAVSAGELDPEDLPITRSTGSAQLALEVEESVRAALGDHADDPFWNR